jgi:hypothetical protein
MTPQETFLSVLRQVLGQALDAAGYSLQQDPLGQGRGLFRFRKKVAENHYAFIDFQTLYYPQSDLSRFRISLIRSTQPQARAESAQVEERTLAHIMWHEYNARVLPADDHWWLYKHPPDLGQALYEAGKLLFGYGIPWVEGTDDTYARESS